jgi:hypothetical protein
MRKATRSRPSTALTPQELDRMAAEFEREFVADTFGPPPPGVRARLRRAKQKRGRPRTGAGCRAISVTIERTLLARVDALVRRSKMPRAQLIARGLRFVLAAHEHRGRGARRASKPRLTGTAR